MYPSTCCVHMISIVNCWLIGIQLNALRRQSFEYINAHLSLDQPSSQLASTSISNNTLNCQSFLVYQSCWKEIVENEVCCLIPCYRFGHGVLWMGVQEHRRIGPMCLRDKLPQQPWHQSARERCWCGCWLRVSRFLGMISCLYSCLFELQESQSWS